jgi:hypothetical protein
MGFTSHGYGNNQLTGPPSGAAAPLQLSLRQLNSLVNDYINRHVGHKDLVQAQVHSPNIDNGGDIADDGIFANPLSRAPVADQIRYKPVGRLIGHTNHVDCIAWSPDGTPLATGSYDNTLRIWDASTRECRRV